jgi:hypothetical protein
MALTKQISNRALILSPTTAEVSTAQTIAPYYDFRVEGVLEIPLARYFDCGRYIHADQDFISVKVSVRVGGTSGYDIRVKSYDLSGGDEVLHVEVIGQQFTDDNSIYTLSFLDSEILAERTLVLHMFESSVGTPVEDFSLTLVSSLFADLDVVGSPTVTSMKGPSLTNGQVYNLDSKKAIAITSSGVDYASADDIPSSQACIGITSATSVPASPVNLIASGLASNAITGLGFLAGDEIYLGLNGDLIDSATAGAFPPGYSLKQLGFAINADDMWVQISDVEIIT